MNPCPIISDIAQEIVACLFCTYLAVHTRLYKRSNRDLVICFHPPPYVFCIFDISVGDAMDITTDMKTIQHKSTGSQFRNAALNPRCAISVDVDFKIFQITVPCINLFSNPFPHILWRFIVTAHQIPVWQKIPLSRNLCHRFMYRQQFWHYTASVLHCDMVFVCLDMNNRTTSCSAFIYFVSRYFARSIHDGLAAHIPVTSDLCALLVRVFRRVLTYLSCQSHFNPLAAGHIHQ